MPPVPAVLPWLLGAVALLLAVVRAVTLLRMQLDPQALAGILGRLLKDRSFERVAKICKVIPETALGPAIGAVNDAAMSLSAKKGAGEEEIRVALRAAYEPAFDAAVRPVFATRWMSLVSIVGGVAAVGSALTIDPPSNVAAGLGALALLGVALNVRWATKIIGGARFLDDVLPQFVDAIRDPFAPTPKDAVLEGRPATIEPPKHRAIERAREPERDDPRGWADRFDSIFYGFDTRSPDLFFEIVAIPFAREVGGLRAAKLRRGDGTRPRYVVAIFGATDDLRRFRDKIEREAAARYASCTTPASEIAPDATYGSETRTRDEVLGELRASKIEPVATSSS